MPDEDGRLFAREIADRMGISAADFRARVSRGYAPASVGHVVQDGAVRAVWDPQEIEAYLARRAERLAAAADHSE